MFDRFPSLACTLRMVGAVAMAAPILAHAATDPRYYQDAPGGKDSPYVSRYTGSNLYVYGDEPLGSAKVLITGKTGPELQDVEGRISNRFYWGPKGVGPLEVHRNFVRALQGGGYQVMYACEESKCIQARTQSVVTDLPRQVRWKQDNAFAKNLFDSGTQRGFHWITARKPMGKGHLWVQVGVSSSDDQSPYDGRVRQFVQVIEPAEAEMGKVTVDAKAIGDALGREGRIALYGVLFDTNKAVLRPDSADQLRQMADALRANPALKVFIVGHTDNQGDFEANLGLSQRRAQAVAEKLGSEYGIAAARMTARGVANLSPLASNADEAGRARNRRVELVVR